MAYVPSFKNLVKYLDHFAHCLSSDVITPPSFCLENSCYATVLGVTNRKTFEILGERILKNLIGKIVVNLKVFVSNGIKIVLTLNIFENLGSPAYYLLMKTKLCNFTFSS